MWRAVRDELAKYFSKVIYEEQGHYMFFLLSSGQHEYVLCMDKASQFMYGKIVRLDNTAFLNCRELEYEPRGLYVFARNPSELVGKILSKLGSYKTLA
ncbi:hypothetical protein DKAM_0284 [Desulfurococcus amylolyticus 1221n]|uniref:Uncharacterized protein n=1 Tax=Desulfurococcus amylolyticus (strain DSM 18924 / JCM 16383 / VKM B-2413 / 1221n) TaxID=490899 RepID=B8D2M2_DESA1|nr:hypothetical protein [Desulfurococcus amylolyticus]ACL10610.1 hypothetical protein DKAM_0284 [Desulfurococcus amylolyticus 1221n]